MLERLLQFDRHVFYIINHDMTNPFFDSIMPWASHAQNWIPLYVLIIVFCLWKYKKKGLILIAVIALSAGLADCTCNLVLKPLAQRVRPCRDPATAPTDIARVGCGMGYSFPSIHAADHFATAIVMILIFCRKWRWIWFWAILWAALISFSRIYVGVHFPSDVLFGILYGTLIGWLFALLFKRLQARYPTWVPVV